MKKAMKGIVLLLIIALATSLLVACDTTEKPETTPEPTPQVGDVIDNGDGTVTTITQLNNPILPGYHADPSAYLFDDTYYIYSTTDGYIVSGNGGWPMIWKSTDFVNWSAVEMELLNSKGKKFSEAADGYWAPSMAKVGEKYYLFFTLADYQIRVATGDSPEGPFTVQGGDLVPKNKTIDPQAFVDDDGKLYITYLMYEHGASGDIMTVISELDPEDPTEVIETKIIEELSRVYREGQELLKKDGKYYLFYSEGNWTGTDYHVCYAMADSIYGPYTIKGTILESADANLVGTGHHSTLQLKDGQYVMVYHRQSIPFIGFGYRQVCVDNMLFNEDGKAFTQGYKEVKNGNKTNYYYFLMNGQAFTTGYKIVKINGATEYFFFQNDGTAYTKGFKSVPFGNASYYYYFQENGKACKSTWKTTSSNNSYYLQDNGRAAKNTFLKINKNLYYFNGSSVMKKDGWFKVGKGYYYAENNGCLVTNKVIEGYKLDSTGKSETKYRIIQLVNKHTNDSMSNQEKIKALYNWVLTNNMTYIRTYEHTKSDWVWKDSWVDDMAKSQMDNNGGNCFRYAAFLGMLIREATGLPVMVYHGQTVGTSTPLTPHGWVTVYQDNVWYVYDVELDKFSNYDSSFLYKVHASKSNIHLQGVGTKLY